ncbi:MAG: hypothetical protein GY853_16515 [PVC group bacterium]|nr:hypothetical protein [PVC group bacterium]
MSSKNERLSIRLTSEQLTKIKEEASKADMKLSEYVRSLLFVRHMSYKSEPIKRITKDLVVKKTRNSPKAQVLGELKSIFEQGLALIKVSDEMKDEVKRNRERTPLKPKTNYIPPPPNLKPPP